MSDLTTRLAEVVDVQFARHERRLARALKAGGGLFTPADVKGAILAGRAWIFPTPNAVAIVRIHEFPQARVLEFWLLLGDMQELLYLEPILAAWGRDNGCTRAVGHGRRGWGRVLARRGYRPLHETFERRF